MTPPSCPRSFEAEAARDGRLAGAELASFQRHAATCPSCVREVKALEALGAALRAVTAGGPELDQLHARRERTRLLAAFDRHLVAPERSVRAKALWPALLVAALGAVVLWRARPPAASPRPSSIAVHAEGDAGWSEQRVGAVDQVRLDRGTLWIHVEHSSDDLRLLVLLPDGVLEDTGTTFTVTVQDGRTTRVAVQDGRVQLRGVGAEPVDIGAGATWLPAARPVASAATSTSGSPPGSPAPAQSVPEHALGPARRPHAPATGTAASVRAGDDTAADFHAAMAAFDGGDDAAAAAAFASFLTKHPADSRAEDAAYLRAVALQRAGDASGMKGAAQEYLRRFPSGFRRAEVEALSR
jgi:hypothetical protein